MQIFNLNIEKFISKINYYAIFIISFLKKTFNNIINIKEVDFHLGNLLNSTEIIINFIVSLLYILIFITFLVFIGSLFNIIKRIIKWILFPKSFIKQSIITDKDLIELKKKITDLEYKNNLMIKYIKDQKTIKGENKNEIQK